MEHNKDSNWEPKGPENLLISFQIELKNAGTPGFFIVQRSQRHMKPSGRMLRFFDGDRVLEFRAADTWVVRIIPLSLLLIHVDKMGWWTFIEIFPPIDEERTEVFHVNDNDPEFFWGPIEGYIPPYRIRKLDDHDLLNNWQIEDPHVLTYVKEENENISVESKELDPLEDPIVPILITWTICVLFLVIFLFSILYKY